MGPPERVTLVPTAAGLHLRWPRFNAAVVLALLRAEAPDALALEPLAADFDASNAWRDHDELLLPWVVVPWARRAGARVYGVHEPSPDPTAQADLERYLADFPSARRVLDELAATLRPLPTLLGAALTLGRVLDEVVPLLRDARRRRLEAFGDGPATDWGEARASAVAERIAALDARHVLVVVALDRYDALHEALTQRGLAPRRPTEPPPDDAARERALLDLAWRGEGADVGALVAQLRQLGHAEARYHAAGLLLAHDHPAEALAELEACLALEFAEPWFLPGSLLARLGQLRDLAGDRAGALKAYRGVVALDWAPVEALATARAGLVAPFGAEDARTDASDEASMSAVDDDAPGPA